MKNQIEKFYGQLYFWVGQNEVCFSYYNEIHKAYKEEYCDVKWSDDDLTRERLKEETTLTLDIGNKYIKQVEMNNDTIVNLIKNNYAYIDIDDIEIFQQFILDYLRMKVENNEDGRGIKTPFRIYSNLEKTVGNISYMRPELIKRVKDKFEIKRKQLDKMTK